MTDRAHRWEIAVVLVLLVTGGALGMVVTNSVWGRAYTDDSLLEMAMDVTGLELLPVAQTVAILALVATIGIWLTRGWGRRLLGTVLAAAGLAIAGSSYALARDLPTRVTDWAGETGFVALGADADPSRALWNTVAGLLICVAGGWIAVRGSRWPTLGRRYERGPNRRTAAEPLTSQQSWDALDRREDPTA
jgi:Tryptophan-associated transmembrane protein (Trp_oprn_chp)